ncbi:MAG: hypothetical protein JO172_03060 [Hyphomicrobiales bacterium]|nr:hypothetical protein [Hyphomicrobiales bacterium]
MGPSTYRVQFIDDKGEFAFTEPSDRENAIVEACSLRLRFMVQAIVDDVTGDVVMSAEEIRAEAQRRESSSRSLTN